jgi:hypothetical protein
MYQQKRNTGVGCWTVIGILLVVGLAISAVRYFQDKSEYKKAHAAYLEGNCTEAVEIIDGFLTKFRPFDFAKVLDDARNEKNECQQYMAAQKLQGDNEIPTAFLAYDEFLTTYPESPMTGIVKGRVESLFSSPTLHDLATAETCSGMDGFVNSGTIPDPDQNVPKLLFACSNYYSEVIGDTGISLDYLLRILSDYKDSPYAKDIAENLFKYRDACVSYQDLVQRDVISGETEPLAKFLYDCAEYAYSSQSYMDAVSMYESLLVEFPDHELSKQVTSNYADAMIKKAVAGGAGKIAQPDPSGYTTAGNTIVEIQNDSPESLKIVINGPKTIIEYLDPCDSCQTYSMIGPLYCPEKGPIGKYTLPSGDYQVLVEASSDKGVTPFTGSWTLESGRQMYSCFVIISSIR